MTSTPFLARLRAILAEPLLHFAMIGAGLFVLYAVLGGDDGPESTRITIDRALVERLADRHALVWQRRPTPDELRGLIAAHVRDEIFYREGVAAGLQDDDEIIRRRVRQKLEVLAEESGEDLAADEAALQAYLAANAARYGAPARVSFEQIFFDAGQRGEAVALATARAALSQTQSDQATPKGDSALLPRRVDRRTITEIDAEFGAGFTKALATAPQGRWHGPVSSPFGAHLVRVTEREPAWVPRLDDIRQAVTQDWESQRRRRALEAWYRNARKAYEITYDPTLPPALRSAR
jgi:hypothetical protein